MASGTGSASTTRPTRRATRRPARGRRGRRSAAWSGGTPTSWRRSGCRAGSPSSPSRLPDAKLHAVVMRYAQVLYDPPLDDDGAVDRGRQGGRPLGADAAARRRSHLGPRAPVLADQRGVTAPAQHLQELLGLEEDELLAVLDADPLAVITGDLDHKPSCRSCSTCSPRPRSAPGAPVLGAGCGRPGPPAGRWTCCSRATSAASRMRSRRSRSAASSSARASSLASRRDPGASRPARRP